MNEDSGASSSNDHQSRSLEAFSDSEDDVLSNNPVHTVPHVLPHHGGFGQRRARRKSSNQHGSSHRPRSMRTPSSPLNTTILNNNLPSAPASPPTPAPSPSPNRASSNWKTASPAEEALIRGYKSAFLYAANESRQRMLEEILNLCGKKDLIYVHELVGSRLKRDPFATLPDEISLRILSFVDHPKTLARASQVSRRWNYLVNDDMAWKLLCEKHAFRRMSDHNSDNDSFSPPLPSPRPLVPRIRQGTIPRHNTSSSSLSRVASNSAPDLLMGQTMATPSKSSKRSTTPVSYKTHFKRRYQVETAWRAGGEVHARQITPDQGVVTCLHLTDKYIVVGLDNSKIHVFDVDGSNQKTLSGHMMGVWAMVPWGDTLVSGGCDRDVRVWDMATGRSREVLRGHSSTVRCLRMSDSHTAISGSRDTTIRIWDLKTGMSKTLVGHQASVRCLEVHGDMIASGSYDTTAKIWSIREGRCLRTLNGHFSQIYAIAFDGVKVATGSLDTSVRIWNASSGQCLAALSGHTSLVGQLQMRGDTLVTGGSDGSVRMWSLRDFRTIHRLAAHDNSVTSLQFNESRIISGGSDGRVKVWDFKTGLLVRELGEPADAVWRVSFEEEKAIVMASRSMKTIMEVWSFSPPTENQSPFFSPLTALSGTFTPYSELSVLDATSQQSNDGTSDADVEMADSQTEEPVDYLTTPVASRSAPVPQVDPTMDLDEELE